MFSARVGGLAHNIAVAVFPWRITHAMLRRLRRPKAKTVMVFRGKNEMPRPHGLSRQHPLFDVKMVWTEAFSIKNDGLISGVRRCSVFSVIGSICG